MHVDTLLSLEVNGHRVISEAIYFETNARLFAHLFRLYRFFYNNNISFSINQMYIKCHMSIVKSDLKYSTLSILFLINWEGVPS